MFMGERGKRFGLADDGGYGPALDGNSQAFEICLQSIERASLKPGRDVSLPLDIAASDLFEEGL
jgi:enolase